MIQFEYEHLDTQEEVRKHIKKCEGRHTQQAEHKCIDCNKVIDNRSQRCVSCSKKGNNFGRFNKGKIRLDFRGKLNPNWNNGRSITSNGYIEIISDENHSSNIRGRILEHRSVMEKHLNRKLFREEIIHHIDGNKQNNKIENLELLSQSEHRQKHKPTEECKKKISNKLKNRIFSIEHCKNLSIAMMGNTNGKLYAR